MNKIILTGRLTADPIIRPTKNGEEIVRFSIAISINWTDKKGVHQESTEFQNIFVDGKLVGFAKTLKKSDIVLVEGRMHVDVRRDKAGKVEKKSVEVIAQFIQLIK